MMQSIRARLSHTSPSERQEVRSGIPSPWPTTTTYQGKNPSISRSKTQDAEKGSLAFESDDRSELRPLISVASVSHKNFAALEKPKTVRTGLAMLRQPLEYKGPEDIAAIRRDAEEYRDALFAHRTATLLSAASQEKPRSCKNKFFFDYTGSNYGPRPENEQDLIVAQKGLSNRFALLQSIHLSIDPDRCRFDKKQAEQYACAIIEEFSLIYQTVDSSFRHAPKALELLIDYVTPFINNILCDPETEREIQETFDLTVTHLAWRLANEVRIRGRTSHLERYLSLHAKYQARYIASQALS